MKECLINLITRMEEHIWIENLTIWRFDEVKTEQGAMNAPKEER